MSTEQYRVVRDMDEREDVVYGPEDMVVARFPYPYRAKELEMLNARDQMIQWMAEGPADRLCAELNSGPDAERRALERVIDRAPHNVRVRLPSGENVTMDQTPNVH